MVGMTTYIADQSGRPDGGMVMPPWKSQRPAPGSVAPMSERATLRSVRVPDGVWRAAQERAAAEGVSLSSVVVRLLAEYGRHERLSRQGSATA